MKSDNSIQWVHSHDFGIDSELDEKKIKIVFWLTTVIMVLEIGAGTWSGSMALLADGWSPSGNPHIQFIGFLRHGALFVKENDHGASSTKRSRRLAQFI